MKLAYILAIMIATSASSALAAPAREAPSQPLLQAKPLTHMVANGGTPIQTPTFSSR
jgi:hypothetical protein